MHLPIVEVSPLRHNNEDRIGIKFSFEKNIINSIKKIDGIKWSKTNSCWHLPITKQHYYLFYNCVKNQVTINNQALSNYLHSKNIQKDIKLISGQTGNESAIYAETISKTNLELLLHVVEHLQIKAYSTSTIKTYKNELLHFFKTLKKVDASKLCTIDVRRYIHYCITKLRCSESTAHSRINALKYLYEQVLGHEKFFVEIPRPKKPLKSPPFFNKEEITQIINQTKNLKHKTMLMLCYSTGMRVSEVVSLKVVNVDSVRMQIKILQAKGKKDRIVNLSPVLLVMLREYYKKYIPSRNGYLFVGQKQNECFHTRSLQIVLSEAKKRAGILKPGGVHALRHSFATHLIDNGTDIYMIMKLLGHNEIKTTMRYLHVTNRDVLKIISPLDDLKISL